MRANKIVLENDSQRYLIEGSQWTSLSQGQWQNSAADSGGSFALVSDFGINPEFRQVYGDRRYSKFLLLKELRDAGEAVSNSELLVYQTSRVDKLNSRMLYSLVSRADFEQYQALVKKQGSQAQLYSLYTLYAQAIKTHGGRGACAFVFVFPGSIDIAVVNNGIIESFQSLSGLSSEQLYQPSAEVSINAVADNITTQERIARLKLSKLCVFELLDGDSQWIEQLALKSGLEVQSVPVQKVTVDGVDKRSTVAPLLKKVSVFDALGGQSRKIESISRSWLPAVAVLVAVICGGLYWYSMGLQQDIRRSEQSLLVLNKELRSAPAVDAIEKVDYQGQLEGIESILQAGIHDNYFQLINKVAEASKIRNPVIYDLFEINYPQAQAGGKVVLDLAGFIDSGWDRPLAAFDKLSSRFAQQGFVLVKSAIDTEDNGLSFAYRLELTAEQ